MLEWRWLDPWWLLALPLPLAWLAWQLWRGHRRRAAIVYSDLAPLAGLAPTWRQRALALVPWMRTAALVLGIVALARPQYGLTERRQSTLGIDIAVALDVSGSMDANDFEPTRLDAAKRVINEFIAARTNDRLCVVIFGTEASVLVPPTFDHAAATRFLEALDAPAMFAENTRNTAIGMGLALAVKQLDRTDAPSKVVILLTDGENTAGLIQPKEAAELAAAKDVRVYTIGVGSNSVATRRVVDRFLGRTFNQPVPVTIDEEVLKHIAQRTGGQYFRATDAQALASIYEQIDKLERSEIQTLQYDNFNEQFAWFWVPALALLAFEGLLRGFLARRLP